MDLIVRCLALPHWRKLRQPARHNRRVVAQGWLMAIRADRAGPGPRQDQYRLKREIESRRQQDRVLGCHEAEAPESEDVASFERCSLLFLLRNAQISKAKENCTRQFYSRQIRSI